MSLEIVGPTREGSFIVFGVIRHFDNLTLRFKISFEERKNVWHHTSFTKEQDGLCRERLYAPRKPCQCIKACEEKLRVLKWVT